MTTTAATDTEVTTTPKTFYVSAKSLKGVGIEMVGMDHLLGATLYYDACLPSRTQAVFARLHPSEETYSSLVGWPLDPENVDVTGPDAEAVKGLAEGTRGWWIDVTQGTMLDHLINTVRTRDHAYSLNEDLRSRASEAERGRTAAVTAHQRDIETVGEALREEAENRDWCSEYDQFVDNLNDNLTYTIAEREHEYEVELDITYNHTVTVTARGEEEAQEQARDEIDHATVASSYSVIDVNVTDVSRA